MKKVFNLILLSGLVVGCTQRQETAQVSEANNIKYAQGFSVQHKGSATHVAVHHPYQGATSGYQYLLVPKGEPIPEHGPDEVVIRTPIEKVVCTSTTHLPHLDYLGLTNRLVGFPNTDYVCSEKIRKRIDEGTVVDLGIDKGMNIELLFAQQPELVIGYTMSADLGQLKKIESLGIPVVINSEYLEKSPLGRAEWIKFTALFFGKEKEADSVFTAIEANYLQTRKLVATVETKPSVLTGIVYGDTWFMPGGQNYAAQLLADAGGKYFWAEDTSHGYLELSFEKVVDKASQADYWIGVGSFASLAEMEATESRYKLFRAHQTGQVYNYNARLGAKGGNEFLELGYLRADLVLNDLVKMLHPELLPGHQFYFYQQLPQGK